MSANLNGPHSGPCLALRALAFAIFALPVAASAADTDPAESAFHGSGKVELATDNRIRGLSTSANRPTAKLTAELLHNSGAFAELELTRVSKAQYPGGRGVGVQLSGGYRFGDPDAWHFEVGAQHSRFPGARQPGASGYTLTLDPDTGEIVDAQPVAVGVSPTTTEVFGRLSYGALDARYFYTASRNFSAITGDTVCPSILDFASSLACFEAGARNSRGSQYLELEYTHRLSKASAVAARAGYQRVKNWSSFSTSSFSLEYRHSWRSLEGSAALTGARAKEKGVYDIQLGNGKVRDAAKTVLVLAAGYKF
jgi:Bacterial protein of unknown function (Gcw_chp)